MSIVTTAAEIGGFDSPVVNRIIVASKGCWQLACLFVSVLSIISAIISLLFVKNKPSDMGQTHDGVELALNKSENDKVYFSEYDWTVREAVNTSSFWLITVGSVGLLSSYNVCITRITINFMDEGISSNLAAISMGLITLFSIFGRLIAGFFGDKYEPEYFFFYWSFTNDGRLYFC